MISQAKYRGGAAYRSISADAAIDPRIRRLWTLDPTTAGLKVFLVDATTLRRGMTVVLLNIGSDAIDVQDVGGGALVTLGASQGAKLVLNDASTPAGSWGVVARNLGAGAPGVRALDLFVVGGTGTGTANERYNFAGAAWAAGTAAPNSHIEGAAAKVGGRAFFVGTYPVAAGSVKNDELTEAGAWTNRTDCPFQAGRTMGAGIGAGAFIFGGEGSVAVRAFEAYAWAVKAALPIAKTRCVAVGIGNKAFLIAGEPVSTPNIAYDRVGDFYYSIAPYTGQSRRSIAGFAIADKVYAVGGREDVGPTRFALNEEYTPATDSWTPRAPLAAQRYGGAGISARGQGVYAGGRDNADAASAAVVSYEFDAWTGLTALPAARTEIDSQGVAL